MSHLRQTRPFGRTGSSVTPLALGTSSWGQFRSGESGDERDARILQVARAFFDDILDTNLLDTSNEYGRTDAGDLSELFVGRALHEAGGVAEGLVVQTKLDRDSTTDDFSGSRMRRSMEESLERLGLDRVDVLYLHDPEAVGFDAVMEPGGAVDALVKLKDQGLATSIGISGGPVEMLERFLKTDLFDALVTHNRFTLLDRSADALLDLAKERNVGVCNAAPYGGGALTGAPSLAGSYGYRTISPERAASLARLRDISNRWGVAMGALALGFSLRDPRVHTTIVGASSLDRWTRAVSDAEAAAFVPEEAWTELSDLADGLRPYDAE